MDKWIDKVAVVTGASAGMGAAIAESLVKNGMKVVGLARRDDTLKEMAKKLSNHKGKLYSIKTDLRKEEDILQAFKWIEENLGAVHVLINNAGTNRQKRQLETSTEILREIYDVNLIALQICCREGIKSMNTHNVKEGYIINISSVLASISPPRAGMGTYAASKKAVNAIGDVLREELRADNKSHIRVSTISPGLCNTELLEISGISIPQSVLNNALQPSDIADTVLYLLQLKPHILVSELIMQTAYGMRSALQDGEKKQS